MGWPLSLRNLINYKSRRATNLLEQSLASRRSAEWPRYEAGRTDYIFALGVLAANFNRLEGFLRLHFSLHIRVPADAVDHLFAKLDNTDRLKQISLNLTEMPYTSRQKSAVEYFMRGYTICAQNRNILLHAQALPVTEVRSKRERVIFFKTSKNAPYLTSRYMPSIAQIKAVADSMNAFADYGQQVGDLIYRKYYLCAGVAGTGRRKAAIAKKTGGTEGLGAPRWTVTR